MNNVVNQIEIVEQVQQIDKAQEAVIFRYVSQLVDARVKLKTIKDQQKTYLENDIEYSQRAELASNAKDALKQERDRLLNTPEGAGIVINLSAQKKEVKEIEQSLNEHLESYNAKTGKTTVELDGNTIFLTKKVNVSPRQLDLFTKGDL